MTSPAAAPTKFSWIPLLAALLLPTVVIGGMLLSASRERQAEGLNISAPPSGGIQSAFVEVQLVQRGGAPAKGRKVTFTHQLHADSPDGVGGEEYHSTSDSDGIATLSVPKFGRLTIDVEGMEKKTVLPAMEMHGSRSIKVRLTVDR